MRKLLCMVIIIFAVLSFGVNCFACTAFSVKADKVYCGKNWDWSDAPNVSVFYMEQVNSEITRLDIRLGGKQGYLGTSINNKGLFVTTNYVNGVGSLENDFYNDIQNRVILRDLHEDVMDWAESINEINNLVSGKRIYSVGYPEHVFCSDSDGNSLILESNNRKWWNITSDEPYSVMTNFKINSILDGSYRKTCLRYEGVSEYIEANLYSFDLEDGFECLKIATQKSTNWSLVGVPEENAAYICLKQNFDKIWKISFDDKTMSTYKGFYKQRAYPFTSSGIQYVDLVAYQDYDEMNNKPAPQETTTVPTTTPTPTTTAVPTTTAAPTTTPAPTTTAAPTTIAPTTLAPPTTVSPPMTIPPTTIPPTTVETVPTTVAPTTSKYPTTDAPTTSTAPTTDAPTTSTAPTAIPPTTSAAAPSTVPTTVVPPTTAEASIPATAVPPTTGTTDGETGESDETSEVSGAGIENADNFSEWYVIILVGLATLAGVFYFVRARSLKKIKK